MTNNNFNGLILFSTTKLSYIICNQFTVSTIVTKMFDVESHMNGTVPLYITIYYIATNKNFHNFNNDLKNLIKFKTYKNNFSYNLTNYRANTIFTKNKERIISKQKDILVKNNKKLTN